MLLLEKKCLREGKSLRELTLMFNPMFWQKEMRFLGKQIRVISYKMSVFDGL